MSGRCHSRLFLGIAAIACAPAMAGLDLQHASPLLLKERGIRTLDGIRSSNMQLELHARERAF